jgi:hypothetical protein
MSKPQIDGKSMDDFPILPPSLGGSRRNFRHSSAQRQASNNLLTSETQNKKNGR